MSAEPEVGEVAPDFTLPAHTDSEVHLADLRGKKVALLFYVFDFSPG
jgi:peroxiredoxin Q/BCP